MLFFILDGTKVQRKDVLHKLSTIEFSNDYKIGVFCKRGQCPKSSNESLNRWKFSSESPGLSPVHPVFRHPAVADFLGGVRAGGGCRSFADRNQ